MSTQILQQFKGQSVRIVEVEGEHRFVLSDLCGALGLKQPARVAQRLDEDEKGVTSVHTPGGVQQMLTVNESGLYAVILRSDKPVAREFRKWVTNEVLPSIRKTGSYTTPDTAPALPDVAAMFQQLAVTVLQPLAAQTSQAIKTEVAEAKAELREEVATVAQQLDSKIGSLNITSEQIRAVKDLVNAIVARRRELGFANWHWGKVYNEAWQACGVGNLPSMSRAQYPKVVEYLSAELTALRVMNPANMLFSESTAGRA